jgi:hypothetical protein
MLFGKECKWNSLILLIGTITGLTIALIIVNPFWPLDDFRWIPYILFAILAPALLCHNLSALESIVLGLSMICLSLGLGSFL